MDHHVERLVQDHKHATMLEQTLKAHPDVKHVDDVDTNIVIFTLHGAWSDKVVSSFADMGIACFFWPDKVRLVTHLDMETQQVQRLVPAWRTGNWGNRSWRNFVDMLILLSPPRPSNLLTRPCRHLENFPTLTLERSLRPSSTG